MFAATITVATDQNMSVATMIYPLIAIVAFCSSARCCLIKNPFGFET
jgi:hypothetical protein